MLSFVLFTGTVSRDWAGPYIVLMNRPSRTHVEWILSFLNGFFHFEIQKIVIAACLQKTSGFALQWRLAHAKLACHWLYQPYSIFCSVSKKCYCTSQIQNVSTYLRRTCDHNKPRINHFFQIFLLSRPTVLDCSITKKRHIWEFLRIQSYTCLMEERFRADPIQTLAPKQLLSYSQHTQERKKGCCTRKKGRYTVTKL